MTRQCDEAASNLTDKQDTHPPTATFIIRKNSKNNQRGPSTSPKQVNRQTTYADQTGPNPPFQPMDFRAAQSANY